MTGIDLLSQGNDADGDGLSVQIAELPSRGYLYQDWNTGTWNYSAPNDFAGFVTFTYRLYDGQAYSGLATVTIRIANDSPQVSDVSFSSWYPKTNDILTATVMATDAEGDALSYRYVWQVDGVAVRTVTTSQPVDSLDLSQPGMANKGQSIRVEVTVSDPYSSAQPFTSDPAQVINSAPVMCAVQRRWFSVGANPTRQLGHSSR